MPPPSEASSDEPEDPPYIYCLDDMPCEQVQQVVDLLTCRIEDHSGEGCATINAGEYLETLVAYLTNACGTPLYDIDGQHIQVCEYDACEPQQPTSADSGDEPTPNELGVCGHYPADTVALLVAYIQNLLNDCDITDHDTSAIACACDALNQDEPICNIQLCNGEPVAQASPVRVCGETVWHWLELVCTNPAFDLDPETTVCGIEICGPTAINPTQVCGQQVTVTQCPGTQIGAVVNSIPVCINNPCPPPYFTVTPLAVCGATVPPVNPCNPPFTIGVEVGSLGDCVTNPCWPTPVVVTPPTVCGTAVPDDLDGDGFLEDAEIIAGSQPIFPASTPGSDDDGDAAFWGGAPGAMNALEPVGPGARAICTGAYGIVASDACFGYVRPGPLVDPHTVVDNMGRVWKWDGICVPGIMGNYALCQGANSNYPAAATPYLIQNMPNDGYGWRYVGDAPCAAPFVTPGPPGIVTVCGNLVQQCTVPGTVGIEIGSTPVCVPDPCPGGVTPGTAPVIVTVCGIVVQQCPTPGDIGVDPVLCTADPCPGGVVPGTAPTIVTVCGTPVDQCGTGSVGIEPACAPDPCPTGVVPGTSPTIVTVCGTPVDTPDADGDGVPDAAEPTICSQENPFTPIDGTCVGGDYTPPV